jgi:multidrug efflux system membrane fusion protein
LALLLAIGASYAVYVASTKEPAKQASGFGAAKRGGAGSADIPVPVIGGEARRADVPVFIEGVGTARALNTVTVKPQVDGRILKVHFREGQTVAKGDLLAEIDPVTFRAQLDQAIAKRALTETQLTNARRDAERYARIPGVVAQKTVDTQAALVAQLDAQLRADSAAVANAEAILGYTRIVAPLAGRTGLRLVDEGNTVRAGGDAGIVTITQVQPISAQFNLPQQQLQAINRALATGPVATEALDADGKTLLDKGRLQVVDNQVDQTTGTVRMKADFPNAQLQLWPGQFVNVRVLAETLKQVVVIATPAVQRGPNGTFVYVVDAEERARMRPVTVSLQTETESVVRSGLEGGERIVVSGFARLQEGSRVIFGRRGGDAPPPKAAAAPGAGQGGGFERIRQACGTDILTHCAVPREEIRACMEANKTKFTAPCQQAIAERASQGKGEGRGKRERSEASGVGPLTGATAREGMPKPSPQ